MTHEEPRRGDGDLRSVAAALNLIDAFVAVRDVAALTREHLAAATDDDTVDLLLLFGACPPAAWDDVAAAVAAGVTRRLVLVGGVGHTTPVLWRAMAHRYADAAGLPEADLMARYLADEHGLHDVLVERHSTNCGSNITAARDLVRAHGLRPRSVVLVQDRTMQRRMDAGFRRWWTDGSPRVVNFAGYEQRFVVRDGRLDLDRPGLWGGWSFEHHVSLLLGEVARLHDTEAGYGPRGRGFVAHVDVPDAVLDAAAHVRRSLGVAARQPGQPGRPSASIPSS